MESELDNELNTDSIYNLFNNFDKKCIPKQVNDTLELPNTICMKCNTKIEEINEYITDVQKINTYLHNCIKKYDTLAHSTELSSSVPNIEKRSDKNEVSIGFNEDIAKDECLSHENTQNQLGTETEDTYECTQCLKLYENQQEYTSHLDAHDRFICKEKNCLKIYNSLRSFKEHQQIHEGKRPFLCVICGKDFASKKCLVCHEKTHAAVKGYKCESCNLDFSVRSNLRTHIKKHHEYNHFYCSQCPKKFMSKCSLDRHEKIHVGIKEFKCEGEDCTSAFYTRKELVKHQKYHQMLLGQCLEGHSVKELKWWLECRSLKQTGSKDELIKRINDCIDNGGMNKMFLGKDQGMT